MSPQARGSAGGRRRHDPASQEDHDKPYVCDSKYRRHRLPSPAPALTPVPTIPVLPGLSAPSPGLLAPPLGPAPQLPCLHLPSVTSSLPHVSARGEQVGGCCAPPSGGTLLCSSSLSLSLCLLQIPISFSTSENYTQKHNSESSNKSTWFRWFVICFPLISFFSSSCPTYGKL